MSSTTVGSGDRDSALRARRGSDLRLRRELNHEVCALAWPAGAEPRPRASRARASAFRARLCRSCRRARVRVALELELFSVSSGRMLRELTAVSLDGYQQLATPAATNDGFRFLTYTSGALVRAQGALHGVSALRSRLVPQRLETLAPGQTTAQSLFSVPGSVAITGEVVPNPDGRKVALTLTPCISTHGTTGLFVRNLNSGATQAIVTSTNRCDGFGPAAWNPTGSQLVFPLEAYGNPIQMGRRDRMPWWSELPCACLGDHRISAPRAEAHQAGSWLHLQRGRL